MCRPIFTITFFYARTFDLKAHPLLRYNSDDSPRLHESPLHPHPSPHSDYFFDRRRQFSAFFFFSAPGIRQRRRAITRFAISSIASGETQPELRIHYRTIGNAPEGFAGGNTSNAILIMHGTTGSGAQFIRAEIAGRTFRERSTARRDEVFHRVARWNRTRKIE